MFNINDGYINALQEALDNSKSKYKQDDELTSDDLLISNIPDLYNCEWDLEFTDLVVCEHCHSVMFRDDIELQTRDVEYSVDAWSYTREEPYQYLETGEEDYEACPRCDFGEDEDEEFEYRALDIEALIYDIDKLKDLEEYAEKGFIVAMKKYIAEQDEVEIKTESLKLEEDDEDYTKLKQQTKSEMLKYLKKNGLDVDNLVKTGVSLENMKSAIDTLLSEYISPVISDYEQQFSKGLMWDYEINDNDIIINIENY